MDLDTAKFFIDIFCINSKDFFPVVYQIHIITSFLVKKIGYCIGILASDLFEKDKKYLPMIIYF